MRSYSLFCTDPKTNCVILATSEAECMFGYSSGTLDGVWFPSFICTKISLSSILPPWSNCHAGIGYFLLEGVKQHGRERIWIDACLHRLEGMDAWLCRDVTRIRLLAASANIMRNKNNHHPNTYTLRNLSLPSLPRNPSYNSLLSLNYPLNADAECTLLTGPVVVSLTRFGVVDHVHPSSFLGYSAAELVNSPITTFVHPDDVLLLCQGLNEMFKKLYSKFYVRWRIKNREKNNSFHLNHYSEILDSDEEENLLKPRDLCKSTISNDRLENNTEYGNSEKKIYRNPSSPSLFTIEDTTTSLDLDISPTPEFAIVGFTAILSDGDPVCVLRLDQTSDVNDDNDDQDLNANKTSLISTPQYPSRPSLPKALLMNLQTKLGFRPEDHNLAVHHPIHYLDYITTLYSTCKCYVESYTRYALGDAIASGQQSSSTMSNVAVNVARRLIQVVKDSRMGSLLWRISIRPEGNIITSNTMSGEEELVLVCDKDMNSSIR